MPALTVRLFAVIAGSRFEPSPGSPCRRRLVANAALLTFGLFLSLALAGPSATQSIAADDFPLTLGAAAVPVAAMPAATPWHEMLARATAGPEVSACPAGPNGRCAFPAWRAWVETRSRLARVAEAGSRAELLAAVDAFVHHTIRYAPDETTWGVADYWATPVEVLQKGQGDCEDHAILKMALLADLGVAWSDMRIVVGRDTVRGQPHAVLAVRLDGEALILDNLAPAPLPDRLVSRYQPLYAVSATGSWVLGYRKGHYF